MFPLLIQNLEGLYYKTLDRRNSFRIEISWSVGSCETLPTSAIFAGKAAAYPDSGVS
jgi:hypothetical protein